MAERRASTADLSHNETPANASDLGRVNNTACQGLAAFSPSAMDDTAVVPPQNPTHAEPADVNDENDDIIFEEEIRQDVEIHDAAISEGSDHPLSDSVRNASSIAAEQPDEDVLCAASTTHPSGSSFAMRVPRALVPTGLHGGALQVKKTVESTADALSDMEKLRGAAETMRRMIKAKQTGSNAVDAIKKVVDLLSEKFEALYSSWADPLVEPKDMFRRNRQCNDEWRLIADYVEKKLFGLHDDDDDIEDPENSVVHIVMDHYVRPTTVPDELRIISLQLLCVLTHMQEFAWDELLDDDTYGNQHSFQWLLDITAICRTPSVAGNKNADDLCLYSRWLLLEYMTPKTNSESKVNEEQFLQRATALIPEIIRTLNDEIALHLDTNTSAGALYAASSSASTSRKAVLNNKSTVLSSSLHAASSEARELHANSTSVNASSRTVREASPDTSSNSSWAEWERLHVGEYGTNFPVNTSLASVRLRVHLQLLGAFFDYRGKTFQRELAGEDVLSPLLLILKHHTRFHVRIVVYAIKAIALSLRVHKFAMRFCAASTSDDLNTERPLLYMKTIARSSFHYYALAAIWDALLRHPSVFEVVLRFSHDSLQQLIQFTLACVESGHLNVVRHASEVFFQSIRAKVFVDLFDGQDGVRRLMNIISTSRLIHDVIESTNLQSSNEMQNDDNDARNQNRDSDADIVNWPIVAANARGVGAAAMAGASMQNHTNVSLSKEEKNDVIKIISEIVAMLNQYLFCDLSIRAERVRFDLARRQIVSRTDFPKFCLTIGTQKVVPENPHEEPMEEIAEFIQLFSTQLKTPASVSKLCLYDAVATLTRFVAVAEKLTETSGGTNKQLPDILHNVMSVLTYMLLFAAGKRRFTEPLSDALKLFMHGVPNYLSFYSNYIHHEVDHDGQLRVPGDLELSAVHLFTNAIYVPPAESILSGAVRSHATSSDAGQRLTPPNVAGSRLTSQHVAATGQTPFGRILSGELELQIDVATEKLIKQMRQLDFFEKILVFLDISHPNADTQQEKTYYEIKRLSIKLLAGMSRLPEVAQILAHLPIVGSGEKLKLVASEKPFFNENEKERRRLQAAAMHLMTIVSRYRRDLVDASRKADIITRTKIDFNQEQLMQVISSYLRRCGFPDSARALQMEVAQKQQFLGFGGRSTPPPSRRMLLPSTAPPPAANFNDAGGDDADDDIPMQPSLFLSPSSFESEHNTTRQQQQRLRSRNDDEDISRPLSSPVRKRARINLNTDDAAVPSTSTTQVSTNPVAPVNRSQQQSQNTLSSARRHRNPMFAEATPAPVNRRRRQNISAAQRTLSTVREPRVTLDEIVKHYFRAEHSQCPYPTVACPPFSFYKRHSCPAPPHLTADVPKNMALVNMERERSLAYSHKTYDVQRRNEMREQTLSCVFGKFRHENDITLGTLPDEDDISGFLAAAYSHDGDSVLFSTDYGEMIQFSRRGGSSGTDWRQVGSPQMCAHPEVPDYDSCSISWLEYSPLRAAPILMTHCQSGVSLWRVQDGNFERLQHKWHLPGYTFPRLSPSSSSNFVIMTAEPSQSVAYVFDIETQQQVCRLHDDFVVCNYERNRPVFHPHEDGLVLNDGVLWDLRMSKPLYKFDPFQRNISGIFHPNGRQAIISSEVWDLRTFKLVRSVPSIKECELKFNITGEIMYGMPLAHESASEDRAPSYATCFYTLSGSTFDTLATISARHEYYDLVLDSHDKQVLLLEGGEEAGHIISPTVAKFYQIGLTKPPPEEVGENVYDSDDPTDNDDDDDDDNDEIDDSDSSSRYGWGSSSSSDTAATSGTESVTLSPSSSHPGSDGFDIEQDGEMDIGDEVGGLGDDDEEFDDDADDEDEEASSYVPTSDEEDDSDVVELSPPPPPPPPPPAAEPMEIFGDYVDPEDGAVDEDYTLHSNSEDARDEVQIISPYPPRQTRATTAAAAAAQSVSSASSHHSGEIATGSDAGSLINARTGLPLRRSTRTRTQSGAGTSDVQQQPVEQDESQSSAHPYSLRRRSRQ